MRIKIDLKIFLIVILFFITRQIQIYATIMFFAFIHELGHLLVGLLLGIKTEKIELKPYGVSIAFKPTFDDYNKKIKNANILELKKIIIALAGPITNLIIAFSCISLRYNSIDVIVYSNLLLTIFNMIPIYPLDGGRILKGALHIVYGKRKAEKCINNISFITILLITLISSVAIYCLKNISIFFIVLILWGMFIKQDIILQRKNKIYNLLEKTIENNENK